MTEDQLRVGKARLKWYKERDEDKIKTDIAKNDFESMIYKLKDWLREEENWPYIKEDARESYMERHSEMEDWLYEDGADMNYTIKIKLKISQGITTTTTVSNKKNYTDLKFFSRQTKLLKHTKLNWRTLSTTRLG